MPPVCTAVFVSKYAHAQNLHATHLPSAMITQEKIYLASNESPSFAASIATSICGELEDIPRKDPA